MHSVRSKQGAAATAKWCGPQCDIAWIRPHACLQGDWEPRSSLQGTDALRAWTKAKPVYYLEGLQRDDQGEKTARAGGLEDC